MNVTGIGAVTCLGPNARALFEGARDGRSGLSHGLGRIAYDGDRQNAALDFAEQAAREALAQAGWTDFRPDDLFILATTTGQILRWEKAFWARNRGQISSGEFRDAFTAQPLASLGEALSLRLGLRGPVWAVSSACSAATQALGLAQQWLRQGRGRRVLVGGVEVLCDLTVEGFRSLQLLSAETSRPFDIRRQGINLSEGAAFLCLESRSDRTLAWIRGAGFSTDGHHMTGPHPEGDGIFRAMRMALSESGLSADEIDWVHAHGTGSSQNDVVESRALNRVFAAGAGPWVSSTKAVHGHALGASGALESVLAVQALLEQTVLPTVGLQEQDPECRVRLAHETVRAPIRHLLKNTLGFGGNNAALVFSRAEDGGRRWV